MATEPLTPIEIEEGWVAKPCGCAYHPGENVVLEDDGKGYQLISKQGFRARWCDEHTAEIMREREALRYRLFEAPDTPAPNRLERYAQELARQRRD